MTEVISLSYGQESNHVITHLYNTQESLIPYTPTSPLHHDLQVFLSRFKSTTSTYSPRALIYDLRNGLGALNKFEYHETIPTLDMPVVNQHRIPEKNEYQKKLDEGITDGSLLNTANTTHWTDYNKLIYNPKSLHTVKNFVEMDKGKGHHYNFHNLKFELYNVGQEEFKDNNDGDGDEDGLIENFRYFLEKADNLQGLQVFTNIDDAWGGFTSEMILELVDEYFNNNNKMNLWIYGLISEAKTIKDRVSRIKTLAELTKQSNMLIPFDMHNLQENSSLLSDKFNPESSWHKSSIPALFINSIWGLNNQFKNGVNMSHLQSDILQNNENRKIINQIKIVGEEQQDAQMMDVKLKDIDINNFDFSSLGSKKTTKSINLGLSKDDSPRNFVKNYISETKLDIQGENTNQYLNPYIENMVHVDTFPTDILSSTKFYTEFNIHDGLKEYLKPYQKLISG
ncbi:hypothetical protein G210_4345 [Candida maltosa Xu316]|uniref:Protein DML1 n=1 Tax=Candida maltosa (strain Xu316) TaxID=1245528 RepID=M3JRQ3_CANMX|nr:hypothetical protein G210_4345 [Candida maltosa Xu316]